MQRRMAWIAVLAAALVMSVGSAAAQTKVRIMGYGGQDPAIMVRLIKEVIGNDLKAQGIEVSYEPLEGDYNASLYNALSAGTAADLFYIPAETAPGIIATGKVLPLNGRVDTSPFIGSLQQAFTVDGKVYGIAKDFNTLALFYNKDLFDEAGVPYPTASETWDSLAQKLKKIAALGSDVYGACLPADFARFGPFAFSAGWKPFAADGSSNLLDPAFVKAVDYYTGLVKDGVAVQPSDVGQSWGGGCFATDNFGVAFEGAWILGFLRNQAPNLKYGTTYMPIGPSGQRGNFTYTVAYGVNKDSPHLQAALTVLKALTSAKAQQWVLEQGLAIPSRKALADNPYFQKTSAEAQANAVIFKGASMGEVVPFQFGKVGTDWMKPVNNALSAIMTGQQSVDAALKQAQSDLSAAIQRAQKP